jgi:hypothetical protein
MRSTPYTCHIPLASGRAQQLAIQNSAHQAHGEIRPQKSWNQKFFRTFRNTAKHPNTTKIAITVYQSTIYFDA